ncbi:MAG: ABC transporter, permease protein, partial [Clostridium butyricum DORA_1]
MVPITFLSLTSKRTFEKMRIILKIKLTLDRRRTSTIMGSSNKKDEESENSFVYALIM